MTTVNNSFKPPIEAGDNAFKPPIKKCLGYWYGYGYGYGEMPDQAELKEELTKLCQVGLEPPLPCMFDRLEFCKGKMLIELTRNSSTITPTERELLWRAAFGQELVREESEKSENRTVKAIFLQWLLTNPNAVKLISTNGIRANGIIIEGNLNLENVTINFPVVLEKSQFLERQPAKVDSDAKEGAGRNDDQCLLGDINLVDAKTSFLSFKGSTCRFIKARRITVKSSFCLDPFEAKPFEAKKIDICGANISGDLDCTKGRFINKGDKAFLAEHIQVGGSLFLTDSYVEGEVDLLGAKIGGNLNCSGGKFKNWETDNTSTQNEVHALDTSLAEVSGKVCFSVSEESKKPFRAIGHVLALEMKVGGDFDCTGGRIEHKTGNCHAISIDRSNIGGSVLLCQGFSATGQVRLIGTKIASDLDCSGGKFDFLNEKNSDNALYAPRLEVNGNVFFCASNKPDQPAQEDFLTIGWFRLEFANISHSIKVGKDNTEKTSIFSVGGDKHYGIDLSGAKITGSLEWLEVTVTEKTELHLHCARVGNLVTLGREKSWPNLWLDDFVYDRIEHRDLGNNYNNYETHLKWLKKQVKPNPQIYEQLAAFLHRNGQDADAIKVSIEKEKIRHKSGGRYWWLNPFKWLWRSIGYGYRVRRALVGSLIAILLGWYIFDKANDERMMIPTDREAFNSYTDNRQLSLPPYYPTFVPLVYSFDAFLPIGKLQQQEKWQPRGLEKISIPIGIKEIRITLRYYLYVHAVMGWLLTTLGLAGLLQTIVRNK